MPAQFPAEAFQNELLYRVEDGVAVITLNAPQRMNSMGAGMNQGMVTALDLASDDPAVRVVVITGAGKAFCVGGDLKTGGASGGFKAKSGSAIPPTVAAAARNLRVGSMSSEAIRALDKPTIAAVNGACAGAGLGWACACDLRFCTEDALFRTAFATAGLSGDYGTSWTLPRIVGPAKARELYFLNPKVRAAEARRIGLVSEVYPRESFMPTVMKIAKELAAGPPLAIKRIKQNLNDADAELSFGAHVCAETDRHARTAFHEDAAEAGRAFVQKRTPRFAGVPDQEPWRLARL
eukprot:TRINITY_DN22760_c0_g1_i1.p2 TRINITY_DN22760_c0_g1~~TRINITY_DN22760_c0_g1_i1.p2  ORF type:complete len:319 (+),score=121.83 TRINITY_DN22760_c0_g1_i1:81-959(+)